MNEYIDNNTVFYSEQGEFLIPKGLLQKDVMNLTSILNSSIFTIETYLSFFDNTDPKELRPEEKERFYSLQKTVLKEKEELRILKEMYQEFFI